jgi:hypothetical protein
MRLENCKILLRLGRAHCDSAGHVATRETHCDAGGHGFSRADKPFIFVIPSGLQPARNLLFWDFLSQLLSYCVVKSSVAKIRRDDCFSRD